ncbi:MAG: hypothetical protein OXH50_12400 [Gemmatimonadetes bacterium]|nr:hypothetical protein [Gemmatimonadota bacterium]
MLLVPTPALGDPEGAGGAGVAGETEARELYESAFRALANGRYGTAYGYLNDLTARYPRTLFAPMAAERKKRLVALGLHRAGRGPGDREGRTGALVYGTLYSTWLGVGTAIVAGADSDQALAAGMMTGAPAGLLATHLLTRGRALSPGQGALVRLGGLWGTWQGFGWTAASADEPSERRLTAFSMAGGLAGIAGSSAIARIADLSTGDASLLDFGGLWGTWFGFCLSVMAEADDNAVLKSSLTGGNLGLAAMAMLVPRVGLSREQVRLINLGGMAGTFVATGIVGLLALGGNFENATVPMGIITAGGIAGLWSGFAIRRHELSSGAFSRGSAQWSAERGWPAPAPGASFPAASRRSIGEGPPHGSAAIRAVLMTVRF